MMQLMYVCIAWGGMKKMARLFQELKLDFDRKKWIADLTAPRFNLLMRTNSCRKIIGIYFKGYTMTNTKHWSLYYCGYRAMKILNKKKKPGLY